MTGIDVVRPYRSGGAATAALLGEQAHSASPPRPLSSSTLGPATCINKLNAEINAGLTEHKVKARLADVGLVVPAGSDGKVG